MAKIKIKWSSRPLEGIEHLGEPVKELAEHLPAEIDLGEAVFIVGSSLKSDSPNDIDVLVLTKPMVEGLAKVIGSLPKGKPLHLFPNDDPPHGTYVPIYRLKLERVDAVRIEEPSEYVVAGKVLEAYPKTKNGLPRDLSSIFPCSVESVVRGNRIQIQKWYDRIEVLDVKTGEPLEDCDQLKLEVWQMEQPAIGVWDAILQENGHCVILDVLVWDQIPAFKLPLSERKEFLRRTELNNHISVSEGDVVLSPAELIHSLESRRLEKAVVRPLLDSEYVYVVSARSASQVVPGRAVKPLKVGSGYHKEEWFSPDDVWKFWVKPHLDKGDEIIAEEKYDGFRCMIHKQGDKVWLFSDQMRDITDKLPELVDAAKKIKHHSFIIDSEAMAFQNGEPVPRIDLAQIWGAKSRRGDFEIRAFVFDCIYLDGRDLHELSFAARRKALEQLLKHGPQELILARQSGKIKSRDDLQKAWEALSKLPGSEGIMLKVLGAPYELDGSSNDMAKLKRWQEADYLIIGMRKLPEDKPANVHWTKEQAMAALPDLLKKSKTYIFRVALGSQEGLIPVESRHRLTERDLHLDWDEEKQAWVGTDDPKLWKMFHGFKDREAGELAYANTYAIALDEPVGAEDCITIAAAEIDLWKTKDGKQHISWQHPRVRTIKRGKKTPDSIDFVKRMAKMRHEDSYNTDGGILSEAKSPGKEGGEGSEGRETQDVRYTPGKGKRLPFVLQYHARGLMAPDDLPDIRKHMDEKLWKQLGLAYLTKPIDEIRSEIRKWLESQGRIAESIDENWMTDDVELMEASPANAAAKAKQYLDTAYHPDAPPERVVQIGNCHIDLRFMDPSGDFLHGWTMITSPMAWQALSGDIYYPVTDAFLEGKLGVVHWVCASKLYQPLPWLTLVKPGHDWWAPPGSPGSTEKTWGHFEYIDSGYLYLGTQKSDYHEYFLVLSKHKEINGILNVALIEARGDYTRLGQSGEWWWTGFRSEGPPYILHHDRQKKEEQAKKDGLKYIYWNPEGVELAYKDSKLSHIFDKVDSEKVERALEQYKANGGRWSP